MTTQEIVERIRYFRRLKKVSARDLSLRLGKHETYINKLECTDFNLPLAMFLQILGALDVSLEEFFSSTDNSVDKVRSVLLDIQTLVAAVR